MGDHEVDKSFAASEAWFAISLLRQSSATVERRPTETDDPDKAIEVTAQRAHRRLLEHLVSLPEDTQRDAASVMFWAMIREYLHATRRRPASGRAG